MPPRRRLMRIFLGMALVPFLLFLVLLLSIPLTVWVKRRMKDGRLKRLLLYRWH